MMRKQRHVSPFVIVFSMPIRMPGALVDDESRVGGARGVSNYRGNIGYCRVASSETVHCEGSSGPHPPARYRTNFRPSHGPRRAITQIPLQSNVQVTHTYTYFYLSAYLSFSISLPHLHVHGLPLHVCAHACKCLRHQVV